MTKTEERRKIAKWLISVAKAFRGCLVGNPDPEPLQDYDFKIREARRLLLPRKRKTKNDSQN